jgi:uncharacterized protein YunC (DUF1805 family)
MKTGLLLAFAISLQISSLAQGEESMDNTLRFELSKPLLVIKEKKGFLACAYINPETCNKTGEACAIVSGVNSYDDMKRARIIAVSLPAEKLGIKVGDLGQEALEILK